MSRKDAGADLRLTVLRPMNAVMNYWFVWRTYLGSIGAPIATVITHWTMALSLMIYAAMYGNKEAWPGWAWEDLRGLEKLEVHDASRWGWGHYVVFRNMVLGSRYPCKQLPRYQIVGCKQH